MRDDKRLGWPQIVMIVGLAVNFGGLVWNASAINSKVDVNEEAIETHTEMIYTHAARIEDHEARLQVKDAQRADTARRLKRIEEKLDKLLAKEE
jgi:hypothetical protein